MSPARATHAGGYRRTAEPQTPAALAWLACNGSRPERRAALRDLRRLATAPAKKETP